MLQRDGHPTALGEAIAMYGRIFKTLHILSYIDTDETYRRDIKGIRNKDHVRGSLQRSKVAIHDPHQDRKALSRMPARRRAGIRACSERWRCPTPARRLGRACR